MVARIWERGKQGVSANGHLVSFWAGEMFWNKVVMMSVQFCECTKYYNCALSMSEFYGIWVTLTKRI